MGTEGVRDQAWDLCDAPGSPDRYPAMA